MNNKSIQSEKLPPGWKWVKLGEIGFFDSGGTPSKSNEAFWNGKIPFVTGADITSFYIDHNNARAYLSEVGLHSGKTAICEAGIVLLVTRTRVGRVGIVRELMGVSQDISPYKCGNNVSPEYVCRYIQSISDHLIDNCRGATIQGLTKDFINKLQIPLPPLSEQKRIVKILEGKLAAVEKAKKAAEGKLELINKLPQSYLKQAFEGKL